MKQIAFFILLALSVSCNNSVKVLKFLDKVECVKTGANLSFEEINFSMEFFSEIFQFFNFSPKCAPLSSELLASLGPNQLCFPQGGL